MTTTYPISASPTLDQLCALPCKARTLTDAITQTLHLVGDLASVRAGIVLDKYSVRTLPDPETDLVTYVFTDGRSLTV